MSLVCCAGCLDVQNQLRKFTSHSHFDFAEEPGVTWHQVRWVRWLRSPIMSLQLCLCAGWHRGAVFMVPLFLYHTHSGKRLLELFEEVWEWWSQCAQGGGYSEGAKWQCILHCDRTFKNVNSHHPLQSHLILSILTNFWFFRYHLIFSRRWWWWPLSVVARYNGTHL